MSPIQLAGTLTPPSMLFAALAHLCGSISATVVLTRRHRPVAEQEEYPLRRGGSSIITRQADFLSFIPASRTSFFLQAACFRRPRFHRQGIPQRRRYATCFGIGMSTSNDLPRASEASIGRFLLGANISRWAATHGPVN